SRHEFNDYLAWTASHFEHQCAFGESVFEVLPEMQGKEVSLLRVRARDERGQVHERLTRSLVIGVGGAPNIPPSFAGLKDDTRVFHSSRYLSELRSEEHTSELQSRENLVCRLLLEKKENLKCGYD